MSKNSVLAVVNEATCFQTGELARECKCQHHAAPAAPAVPTGTVPPMVSVVNAGWKPTPMPDVVVNYGNESQSGQLINNVSAPSRGGGLAEIDWQKVYAQ